MYKNALNILKEHPTKALCGDQYQSDDKTLNCAIGYLCPTVAFEYGSEREIGVYHIAQTHPEFLNELYDMGLTNREIEDLQIVNDNLFDTPQDRYQGVIKWLENQVLIEEHK